MFAHLKPPRARLQFQGRLVAASLTNQQPVGSGLRGRVGGFSRASRLRLVKLTNILREHTAKFLTLTLHHHVTPQQAKIYLRRLLERIRRRWPNAAVIWRLEPQKRWCPHFHLIMFGVDYMDFKIWLQWWRECTEQPTITNLKIKGLRGGQRQTLYYVSKYVAKTHASPSEIIDKVNRHKSRFSAYRCHRPSRTRTNKLIRAWVLTGRWPIFTYGTYLHADNPIFDWVAPGRWWGVQNREGLPYAVCTIITVDFNKSYFDLKRAMRKIYSKIPSGIRGACLFVKNAKQWEKYYCFLVNRDLFFGQS